jgi:hypothetical protein
MFAAEPRPPQGGRAFRRPDLVINSLLTSFTQFTRLAREKAGWSFERGLKTTMRTDFDAIPEADGHETAPE